MYKQDLALNNPQGLICHETQSINQLTINYQPVHVPDVYTLNFLVSVSAKLDYFGRFAHEKWQT